MPASLPSLSDATTLNNSITFSVDKRRDMFKITDGKGYQMTFPNGYTVSVQWGNGNYCENRNVDYKKHRTEDMSSANAEVAVWNKKGWVRGWPYNDGANDVQGFLSPTEVLDILNWAAQQK